MDKEEFEAAFREALEARDAGEPMRCISVLRDLLAEGLHRPAVIGTLGLVLLYEAKDPGAALPVLRESVLLSPNSEKASIGLFHALVETGRNQEASDEAKRFLENRDSQEYSRLLAELPEGWDRF